MNTTIIALGNTSGVPARFNSISEPSDSSIVLPELNSVTEVNCTSEEEVFLHAISVGGIQYGTTADTVNGNSVNQIGVSGLLPCADASGEKAKCVRSDGGEAKPPNIRTDIQRSRDWEEWYRTIWKLKVSGRYQNHR